MTILDRIRRWLWLLGADEDQKAMYWYWHDQVHKKNGELEV